MMKSPKQKAAVVFCPECQRRRPYEIKFSRRDCELRGVKFACVQKDACCISCGTILDVPSVVRDNENIREYAYRKAAGLITVDEIRTILSRYDIGAGPLASVMGFGDVTINRYMGGQLPSRTNSEQLYEVLESHEKMRELLEENNEYISEVAYRKCSQALDYFDALYSSERIEVVTRYLLGKMGEITPLALQKLLYYAQGLYRAIFDTDLFSDPCHAWACGPVFPTVYEKYKDYGYDPVRLPPLHFKDDLRKLAGPKQDFLDEIIQTFGCCSGPVLERMTRLEPPWLEACGDLPSADLYCIEIDPDAMKEHFKKVIKKYNIVNPSDISKYCDALRRQI